MFIFLVVLLVHSSNSANFLGVFVYPSMSHLKFYHQLMEELSLRGHQVTVLTPKPFNDPKLTNLTEISIHFQPKEEHDFLELFYKDLDKCGIVKNVYRLLDVIVENELKNPLFQNLIWDKNQKFDLIFLEIMHPVMFALSHRFQAPVIGILSMPLNCNNYKSLGSQYHPTLNPDFILGFTTGKLTLREKLESFYFLLCIIYHYEYVLLPRSQQLAEKYFGNDIPHLHELEKDLAMVFVNTNPLIHFPRPIVPGIVEMLPLRFLLVQDLPKDLQTVLDKSPEGVIYFSFGSQLKISSLNNKLRTKILNAISELPYKVLLKWELTHFPEKPPNVIYRDWFSQTDVLAHPNVRAFVTQGGLNSLEEAIMREIPLLVVPFFADQPLNARRVVALGIGESVDPTNLATDELKDTILKVAKTEDFKKRIKEVRKILFDRQRNGLDQAVWWSEYIIRHKKTKHLKSPALDFPWFQYIFLDVFLVLSFSISIITYCVYKFVKFLMSYMLVNNVVRK